MRKRTKYKSPLRDFFVIFFCLSIALIFAYKFWQDLNAFTIRSDKKSVGTVSFKHKVAQRKFDDRVVWERISQGTKLYYGDTIRTADLAQAVIQLDDGTVLDLNENTMIKILYNESGALQISVDGDIQVHASIESTEVALKLDDGSVVNVDAGSTLSAKSDAKNGIRNVEVTDGSAVVTTESGQSAKLAFGESVSIEDGAELQKNPLTIISPPKNLKLLDVRGESLPVHFAWNASSDSSSEPVTLQFSSEKGFSSIEKEVVVNNESFAEINVSKTLYWRIYSSSTKDTPVEGKITVDSAESVQGTYPLSGGEIHYRENLPKLNFKWKGNAFADKYRLSVSLTPDMNNVIEEIETPETFVAVDNLAAGSYWWMVTPYYSRNSIGYAGESRIYDFSIVKDSVIPPPKITFPAENARIVYKDSVSLTFTWKSEVKEAAFRVIVARDSAFTDIFIDETVNENKLSCNFDAALIENGTYFWKVSRLPVDHEDILLNSDVRTFNLSKYVPEPNKLVYPPENFVTEVAKVPSASFMWKVSGDYKKDSERAEFTGASETDKAVHSVFQISKNTDFSFIETEKTVGSTSITGIKLSAGDYWWRIGIRMQDGTISGFTQPRHFSVLSELAAPEILSPSIGQEIVVYEKTPVSISWASVAEAEYYILKVFSKSPQSGNPSIMQQSQVRSNSTRLQLPPDSYDITVQSVTESSQFSVYRISRASKVSFTVRNPSPVRLVSPLDNQTIEGLEALASPVVFSWKEGDDKPASCEFVLMRQLGNGSRKTVKSVSTLKKSISFKRLSSGTYYWRVKANTSSGIPIDSEERKIVIGVVPELAPPALISPKSEKVFDEPYFRSNRTLSFSWNPVSGATEYSFTLYKKDSENSLKAVFAKKNIKETQVILKDLTVLDIGSFVWNVTASRHADDGFEEQRGKAASGTFIIKFELPEPVQTKKPEKLYAE